MKLIKMFVTRLNGQRLFSLMTAALLTFFIGACQDTPDDEVQRDDQAAERNGHANGVDVAQEVEVRLTDSGIEMPDQVPVGSVTFRVINAGTQEYSFKIDGENLTFDKEADDIAPGETETVKVNLEPGTYTISRPVEGKEGSDVTLTVTASDTPHHMQNPEKP